MVWEIERTLSSSPLFYIDYDGLLFGGRRLTLVSLINRSPELVAKGIIWEKGRGSQKIR